MSSEATFNFSGIAREMRRLRRSLPSEIPDRLSQTFELTLGFLERPGKLVSVERKPALGARENRVLLKPTGRFRDFVAAVDTLNRELLLFEKRRHEVLPGSRSCRVKRAGGRVK